MYRVHTTNVIILDILQNAVSAFSCATAAPDDLALQLTKTAMSDAPTIGGDADGLRADWTGTGKGGMFENMEASCAQAYVSVQQ